MTENLIKYELIRNNNFTNNLTKVNGKKLVKDGDYEEGDPVEKEVTFYNGDVLTFEGPYELYKNMNNTAFKFLDILFLECKKEKSVDIPLEQFMKLRGLTDIKTAREQVKGAYNMLSQISFDYNCRKFHWSSFNVIHDGALSNGHIKITFDDMFFEKMKDLMSMPYPLCLLAYSDRQNPYTYPIARKIVELVNVGTDEIKISTLLKDLPLPKEEDIIDRHHKRRIIEAFERDLNKADFIKWCYVDDNSKEIEVKDLLLFKEASIKYELAGYPYEERDKRVAARQERLSKKSKRKGVSDHNKK